METLFEKVATLIVSQLHDLIGPRPTNDRPAGFEQRLRDAVIDLLRTDTKLMQLGGKFQTAQQTVALYERQAQELDRAVDAHLLNADETRAAAAQRELNMRQQRLRSHRVRVRRLQAERERLLAIKDKLEVKLSLMGLERQTLDDYLQRYQNQQTGAAAKQTWRVIDPTA